MIKNSRSTEISRIIVALDFSTANAALALADQLNPSMCRVKVGKELFTAAGPAVVKSLVDRGFDVFLDLKFHDIPTTVAAACKAAVDLGVWMLNVHACGGTAMLAAARQAVGAKGKGPKLIAVTVLTSMAEADLAAIGILVPPVAQVQRLAKLAKKEDLDGVVCSPHEVAVLRQSCGADFDLVTPGVRPAGSIPHDQKRVMTPVDAIKAGATYLVIGRPITEANDPLAVLAAISASIEL